MATAPKDKLTGPGKLEKLPDGSTLLFNFDIDSSVIKQEHRAFLDRNIVGAANASPRGLRVVVGGSADRLGNAGHNLALSNRRIEAVTIFLKQRKPGYHWDFVGFNQGVGEANAERFGDKDDTRDDVFRAVIIEVLAPGQPIPPKPTIPKRFPKKPNIFPRPLLPILNQSTCVIERDCPLSQTFSIQLLAGVSAGEIIEAGFFIFMIKDLDNQLECLYSLSAAGLANPGLPASVSVIGKPSTFHPSKATKVTNFGPLGGISSLTFPLHPLLPPTQIFSVLDFTFHNFGSDLPSGSVFLSNFDTGPISMPGIGIHGGRFKVEGGLCRGKLGASRTS